MRDQLVVTHTVYQMKSDDGRLHDFTTVAIAREDGSVIWSAVEDWNSLSAILDECKELDVFVPYWHRNRSLIRFFIEQALQRGGELRVWMAPWFNMPAIVSEPDKYWKRINLPSSAGGPRLWLNEDLIMCDLWDAVEKYSVLQQGIPEGEARQVFLDAIQAHPVYGILGFFKHCYPEWCAVLLSLIKDPSHYRVSQRGHRPLLYQALHIQPGVAKEFLAEKADKAYRRNVAMYAWGVNRPFYEAVNPEIPSNFLWRFDVATEKGLCQATSLFVDILCDYWIAMRSSHPTEWFVPENYFARVPYYTQDDLVAMRTYLEVVASKVPSRRT